MMQHERDSTHLELRKRAIRPPLLEYRGGQTLVILRLSLIGIQVLHSPCLFILMLLQVHHVILPSGFITACPWGVAYISASHDYVASCL